MIQKTPEDLAQLASDLAAALGLVGGGLAALLLQAIEMAALPVGIKERSSGRYVFASEAMAQLFGCAPGQILGATDASLLGAGQAASLRAGDDAAAAKPAASAGAQRLDIGGLRREVKLLRLPIRSVGAQAVTHLMVVWQDLTASRQQEAQLRAVLQQLEAQQLANGTMRRDAPGDGADDETLGLYERAQFEDHMRRDIDLSAREHREFALVAIALDPLSDKVRSLGAGAEARVLESLARLLRGNTRVMDASCRTAHHRFALLLSGVGLATAHARMEGLRRQCATQIVVCDGTELGFSVAMGVASFPHTASVQADLVDAGEHALAEAIRRGGNQVVLAGIRFEGD